MSAGRLAGLGLARLGFGPFFSAQIQEGELVARVAVEHRDRFVIVTAEGTEEAELAGRFWQRTRTERQLDKPVVGDFVVFRRIPAPVIERRLERQTELLRQAAGRRPIPQGVAANIDVVFILTAVGEDLSARRVERFLGAVRAGGAQAVVVLSKADLSADLAPLAAELGALGAELIISSAITGLGLEQIRAHLGQGKTALLVGSSGVGKSTLANQLAEEALRSTADVRVKDDKGRHTTTERALLPLPGPDGVAGGGGLIIDSPGIREFLPWEAGQGVQASFEDVEAVAEGCRFRDCRHEREPGCAVRAAVEEGRLDPGRVQSALKLRAEQDEARGKGRRGR